MAGQGFYLLSLMVQYVKILLNFWLFGLLYTNLLPFIFIGPESDLCLAFSVIHFTDSIPFSKLD